MTRRKKWMALAGIAAVAVLLLILRPWENRRSTTREEQPAPPHREGPTPSAAKKDAGQTTVPKVDQGEQTYSQLEEVSVGSISGRLLDTEGGIITGLDRTFEFGLRGKELHRRFEIGRDGGYSVDGLPEGVYTLMLLEDNEFRHHGRYYCFEEIPDHVRTGTTDANITVIQTNPGAIRGKVLYARTMQPVTRFTVYQKYDFKSAPGRSRMGSLYTNSVLATGWTGQGRKPFVNMLMSRCDSLQKKLESLDPEDEKDERGHVIDQYNRAKERLEQYRLDIVSEEGVFERSGCLLGEYVLTVLAEGCLPESVEVGVYDSETVEVTLLMDGEGSTLVGKVEDDSGRPVRDATVEILIPTSIEYLYFGTADPQWERVRFVTDESGQFAFEDIADGRYEIRASHADYSMVAASSVKVLDHRQEPPSIAVRMRKGDSGVWGQIRGTDGSPQVGTALRISSGSSFMDFVSDGGGYYSVTGLPPGDYVMTIDKKELGDRKYVFSLFPSEQLRYDVSLSGTATLKGLMITDRPPCLIGALPMVLRSEKLILRSEFRYLGADAYVFRLLPPGRYELEVLSDMLGNVRYDVNLVAGEEKWLHVTLGRFGTLKGRVIGRDGEPLSGIGLRLISSAGEASTTSDSEGRYVVPNLSPGHIQLTIPEGKFAGAWYEQVLPRVRPVERNMETELDIDLSSLGDVSGRVLVADGKPLGLAALRVESPHRTVEVVTDREGTFRAEGLFPGACRVHLSWPARARAYPFELAPQEDKELEIVLPP